MGAISDYLRQLRAQIELLESAEHLDSICFAPDPPDFGWRGRYPKEPRHWTRQDRRRFQDYEDFENAQAEGATAEELDAISDRPSPLTRTDRFLRKFKHRQKIRDFHNMALSESINLGIHSVTAPLLSEATQSHERLLKLQSEWDSEFDEFLPEELAAEWRELIARREQVIEQLSMVIPPEAAPAATPKQEYATIPRREGGQVSRNNKGRPKVWSALQKMLDHWPNPKKIDDDEERERILSDYNALAKKNGLPVLNGRPDLRIQINNWRKQREKKARTEGA